MDWMCNVRKMGGKTEDDSQVSGFLDGCDIYKGSGLEVEAHLF